MPGAVRSLKGTQEPVATTAPDPQGASVTLSYEFLATWLRAKFGDSDRGASLVEYALLVALIAVVCIAAVTLLGKNASSKFDSVGNSIGG
jgi:pilus assembly protein Flp/PilA